jgi:hypothetical protein
MRITRIENCVTLDSNDPTRACSFAPSAALFQASADFRARVSPARRADDGRWGTVFLPGAGQGGIEPAVEMSPEPVGARSLLASMK